MASELFSEELLATRKQLAEMTETAEAHCKTLEQIRGLSGGANQ